MVENNAVVTIELDRIRELRFSHKAIKRWSAYTGKRFSDIDSSALGPEEIEVLMYFMMEKDAAEHGEDLKMSDMEDLLDMVPLGTVYEKLSEAMEAAFPKVEKGKNAKRAGSSTGINS